MPDSHLAFTDGGPSIADQTPGKGDERTTSLAEKVRLVPDASGPGGQLRVPPSAPKISLSFVKRKSGGSGLGAWKHSCLKPITDLSFLPVRPPSMLPGFVGLSKDAGSTRSPHVNKVPVDPVVAAKPGWPPVQLSPDPATVESSQSRNPATPLGMPIPEPVSSIAKEVLGEPGCAGGEKVEELGQRNDLSTEELVHQSFTVVLEKLAEFSSLLQNAWRDVEPRLRICRLILFFQGEGEHAGGDLLPAKFFATTG